MVRPRIVVALATSLLVVLGLPGAAYAAAPPPVVAPAQPPAAPPVPEPDRTAVASAERVRVIGPRWQTSTDRAWATSGDGDGFHVLVADAGQGYAWRTAATLAEPGYDADQWLGNACVTGSGRHLAVTYAPRTFTNRAELFARGGFTALVDLDRGAVTKLPLRATLAYYSPACGVAETVVFTQAGDDPSGGDPAGTRLLPVDAATAAVAAPITLRGQVTSAVPTKDGGLVAADVNRLVRIDQRGRRTEVARTRAVPFRLIPDSGGGVVFLDRDRDTAYVSRVATPQPGRAVVATVASGPLAQVALTPGASGYAYVSGRIDRTGTVPATVRVVPGPALARVSTRGEAWLTGVSWAGSADPRVPLPEPAAARPVRVALTVAGTRQSVEFRVLPSASGQLAGTGRAPRPGSPGVGRIGVLAGSPSNPVEDERTCSVPRNDPANQVPQPKPRQVEWAVDQAVRGVLTVQREQGWKNLGMPAYTPQGLFPPVPLAGGGFIPAQVMLGVLAQESNLWQASSHIIPGATGNPLIGNYYGREIYDSDPADDWDVHWADADCGYGVTQLTDGMRLAGKERPGRDAPALPYQTQRAVAVDFAANVAAGVQVLQRKWNETRGAGLIVNGGAPQYIENWFFAVWAYNSGFHPQSQAGSHNGAWGVGWLNNPVNPHYPANRPAFLELTMADAAHPQDWPYPEKVMGFAGHPIELLEAPNVLVPAFRAAWWPGDIVGGPANRAAVKPPVTTFCDATNTCQPGQVFLPTDPEVVGEPAGPCAHRNTAGQYDLKCWFNRPATWKESCDLTCGRELLRFDPGWAYQPDGTAYPPNCTTNGLPANTLIVDDVPATAPVVRPGCARSWSNAGTFSLDFAADPAGNYPSKVDFHQIGGGFGGHFWFAHTRTPTMRDGRQRVTGTWTPTAPINGWTRVKVHIPDHGAWTRQARYHIHLGNGSVRSRVVNQAWQQHTWFDLGVFNLAGNAKVQLTTETNDGTGDDKIAFDAVAFIPTVRPSEFYVAMGDSYSSGEGVEPYDRNSDYLRSNGDKNACHRSANGAYPRLVKTPGHTKPIAVEAAEGTAAFAFIACSGAMTTSMALAAVSPEPRESDTLGHTVWGAPDEHWGEVSQVEQGYLDVDTTLVTLTAGGNDARFSGVLVSCVITVQYPCYHENHHLTRSPAGPVDPEALRTYEKKVIRDWLPEHLKAVYQAVHTRAPNARILVLGYPQLFPDRPLNPSCLGLDSATMYFLNTLADLLNIAIANAVEEVRQQGVDIRFLNATQHWRESNFTTSFHWACASWTEEWTAGPILWSETGSGRDTPGTGSFHPTAAGQAQLAAMITEQLYGVSSVTQVQQRIRNYALSRGWTVSDHHALMAAETCLRLTAKGGVVGDPCLTYPILFPTSANALGAAENDQEALDANPLWVQLNFVNDDNKAKMLTRSWMNNQFYQPNPCPNPRTTGHQCDEYPFYSSELGGAWDFVDGHGSPSSTSLREILTSQNSAEGNTLGQMYRQCGMTTGDYDSLTLDTVQIGSPYLTIPLLAADTPITFYVC